MKQKTIVIPVGRQCLTERLIQRIGFVCIHDGANNPQGQYQLPPDQVACFVRKYQLRLDGEFLSTYIKFEYDKRSGTLINYSLRSYDEDLKGRERMQLVEDDAKSAQMRG